MELFHAVAALLLWAGGMKVNISKTSAFKFIKARFPELAITCKNTVFANLNSKKPVWWMSPYRAKFLNDLFLILNNNNLKLHVFFIPALRIPNPLTAFRQHNDEKVSIEISSTDPDFVDQHKKNIVFKKFLLHHVSTATGFPPLGDTRSSK